MVSHWGNMLWDGAAFFETPPPLFEKGMFNWIQTDPQKSWFNILRLYSPLPSFFDKKWRPSEVELVG